MEQIYYTQCPVGYGVGASGGLQVKRHDPGYPIDGDLRHLGMRAYIGTSRTLAPKTLRYRRDDESAEVALLTPREKEYHTERGFWGRPGGHFAHGLRLSPSELEAIASWPAGLFDWPHWRRDDLEPTRGEPPEPISEPWPSPFVTPRLDEVGRLASGRRREMLPALLTAAASVVREGRCLFLIDEAGALPEWMALLTFAFPPPIRADLTFSTYHDRPEELLGFRIQGVLPASRPNIAVLSGSGTVADVASGLLTPPEESRPWAVTLADWLVGADEASTDAWNRTASRLQMMRESGKVRGIEIWSDETLDHLFAFEPRTRDRAIPADEPGWDHLAELARWSAKVGLAEEWAGARPAAWWLAVEEDRWSDAARGAFLAALGLRAGWRGGVSTASTWGRAAAKGFRDATPELRESAAVTLLDSAPEGSRAVALSTLIRSLPEDSGSDLLDRLSGNRLVGPETRLPLRARKAVAVLRGSGDQGPLSKLLGSAFAQPTALVATLDAIAAEVAETGEETEGAARIFGVYLLRALPESAGSASSWALSQGSDGATTWLSPFLRRILADPAYQERVARLWNETAVEDRPTFVHALLTTALDPNLGRDGFVWAVERLLLSLPPDRRPDEPGWPDAYLGRVPSGFELLRRLFLKETRQPELRRWIAQANKQGRLSPAHVAQLGHCQALAGVLESREVSGLRNAPLPSVPEADRGPLLREMLRALGGASFEGMQFCLDSCRASWPGAFEPGRPGLPGLGAAVAEVLSGLRDDPPAWFSRLASILDRLRLTLRPDSGFEPDSLAAEVVAATHHAEGKRDPWPLRDFLFRDERAWPILAADARLDLRGAEPLAAFRAWDAHLSRGHRLFVLLLNSCDSATFVAILTEPREHDSDRPWVDELLPLPPLPWWRRPPEVFGDLRDRFAHEAEMAPLPIAPLASLTNWMRPARSDEERQGGSEPAESDFVAELPAGYSSRRKEPDYRPSLAARNRWKCLEALTDLSLSEPIRHARPAKWVKDGVSLARLDEPDRRRFVARLLYLMNWGDGMTHAPEDAGVRELVDWLHAQGVRSPEAEPWLKAWTGELEGRVDVHALREAQIKRMDLVHALCRGLRNRAERERATAGKSRGGGSP